MQCNKKWEQMYIHIHKLWKFRYNCNQKAWRQHSELTVFVEFAAVFSWKLPHFYWVWSYYFWFLCSSHDYYSAVECGFLSFIPPHTHCRLEPNGYMSYITENALPNTPTHRVKCSAIYIWLSPTAVLRL